MSRSRGSAILSFPGLPLPQLDKESRLKRNRTSRVSWIVATFPEGLQMQGQIVCAPQDCGDRS